jgi:hypothetical protein
LRANRPEKDGSDKLNIPESLWAMKDNFCGGSRAEAGGRKCSPGPGKKGSSGSCVLPEVYTHLSKWNVHDYRKAVMWGKLRDEINQLTYKLNWFKSIAYK